jgi:hypothetical protein
MNVILRPKAEGSPLARSMGNEILREFILSEAKDLYWHAVPVEFPR